jgi:ribosomal protein L35AE/L33A
LAALGSFATANTTVYNAFVILIRFPNIDAKRRALAYLAGRFSFKSWATGEMLVPEGALAELAAESIQFSVAESKLQVSN